MERELSYVETVVDQMLGGMAEIASGLNHERSIIGVDVKEIQKGSFSRYTRYRQQDGFTTFDPKIGLNMLHREINS